MEGTRLGRYEIRERLGEGGMGEVWRAEDTRLGREVAIKVLPAELAADPDRLARLEGEARVLASLDHPNIATLYGLEEADATRFLVMQLVPGETLADRLHGGALPLEELLPIAIQIAEGLEAAHERGIVHRDLKSANVMVAEESGRPVVKLLDFGLAKASEGSAGAVELTASPTVVGATSVGVLLGTAPYMSPEQARGKPIDRRADNWAFGCVLYEMLTGERPFGGETVTDVLAAVVRAEPDWERLPPSTPPRLRELIERCLNKDLRRRLQHVGDARVTLQEIEEAGPDAWTAPAAAGPEGAKGTVAVAPVARARRPALLALLGGAVLGALAVLAVVALMAPAAAPAAPTTTVRFRLEIPEGAASGNDVAQIAPDGRAIAFGADSALWVRPLDRLEPRRLELPWPGQLWAWTPDLTSLVVLRRDPGVRELWRVPLDGSAPRPIGALPAGGFLWGVSPAEGDQLVFGMAGAGLFTIPAGGGAAEQLLPAGDEDVLTAPVWLPGRRALLFGEARRGRIEALVDGRRRVIIEREGERFFDPLYAPPGYLLVRATGGRSADGIWAFPFSPERLEVTGEPKQLSPYGMASVADGRLVVREWHSGATPGRLVELDRDGRVARAIGEPLEGMRSPALSPDGTRIAVSAVGDEAYHDLFVVERRSGARYRLRDGLGSDNDPFWRDGGTALGFLTFSAGIRSARARSVDGSDEVRLLDDRAVAAVESPEGRYLVTTYRDTVYREEGTDEPRRLFAGRAVDLAVSPDGRWLAYTAVDQPGVFLRRFPSGDGLTPVISAPAATPRFGSDGREVYFWRGESLMSVPVDLSADSPVIGEPRVLFEAAAAQLEAASGFDVTPEGTFLMVQRHGEAVAPPAERGILVIENWMSELSSPLAAEWRR